jgi:hypothetical protein
MFKRIILDKLEKSSLLPDIATYRELRHEITAKGRREADLLKNSLGSSMWNMLLKKINTKYAEDDLIRILGFGNALTVYSILPVLPEDELFERVVKLGTYNNLIISLFDHLSDSGITSHKILTVNELENLIGKKSVSNRLSYLLPGSREKLMIKTLIRLYNRELKYLGSIKNRPQILNTINTVIRRMFAAELDTLNGPEAKNQVLNRKSALPFVLMGMPSWLISNQFNAGKFWSHTRWLYRLGLFLGALDDIVDLIDDIRNGHPNQFKKYLMDDCLENSVVEDIGNEMIKDAFCIKQYWQQTVNPTGKMNDRRKDVLGVCIISWFGGIAG